MPFKCLVSKTAVSVNSGVNLGVSESTSFSLPNAPIVAGTLTGTIFREGVPTQAFEVDASGAFTFAVIESPSIFVTAGTINLNTGVLDFTWNSVPDTCYALCSYEGLPFFSEVGMLSFKASCAKVNSLCNPNSTAYVAAVTVCDEHLYS